MLLHANVQKYTIIMAAVRTNTLKMLERRGYDMNIVESADVYLRIPSALIVFVPDEKVNISQMKNILALRIDEERVVIVHTKTITSEAKNIISSTRNVETFMYDEMEFDRMEIVPVHIKVEGDKPKDWKQYPILLRTDATCRYFGFERGDIVKIVEDDGTICYRRVV